jgi:hypothetical protein
MPIKVNAKAYVLPSLNAMTTGIINAMMSHNIAGAAAREKAPGTGRFESSLIACLVYRGRLVATQSCTSGSNRKAFIGAGGKVAGGKI